MSSESGPTTFRGISARSGQFDGGTDFSPSRLLVIWVADRDLPCGSSANPGVSTDFLTIEVIRHGTDPVGPGTYPVAPHTDVVLSSEEQAIAWFSTVPPSPGASWRWADAGTVTLARVAAGSTEGTVDVTLQDGSRMRGSFSAPRCAY